MRERLAVIGSGVSGLTAAYLLKDTYDVIVYEKADQIGGHTATVSISYREKKYAIDTAFIVFNEVTYPNFITLLEKLGINKVKTDMGFSVRNDEMNIAYNISTLQGFFVSFRQVFSYKRWKLMYEILRFNYKVKRYALIADDRETLGDFVRRFNFSNFFVEVYLIPLAAIIWSQPKDSVLDIPLHFFIGFFKNHGLLSKSDILQWYVVAPFSSAYLKPLTETFTDRVRTGAEIKRVVAQGNNVLIQVNGKEEVFDKVLFAIPVPEILKIADLPEAVFDYMKPVQFTDHVIQLHVDENILPKETYVTEAWNIYQKSTDSEPVFSYHMNKLQHITAPVNFLVTLDGQSYIDSTKVLFETQYLHPQYDKHMLTLQSVWKQINGVQNFYYCGAYWRHGFHEDGVWSGIRAALSLGADKGIFNKSFTD
ncbi:MAG: hypothetical protein RLZZ360_479 [Candidatus Parcubacteria bacterium]|jgi:predicted NAD/FAD-binding protein